MAVRTVKFVNKENNLLLDSNLFGNELICLTNSTINSKVLGQPAGSLSDTQQWIIDEGGVVKSFKHQDQALAYDPAAPKQICLRPVSNKDNQKWILHDNGLLECKGDGNDAFLQGKSGFPSVVDAGFQYWLNSQYPNHDSVSKVEYYNLQDLTKKKLELDEQWELRYVDNNELCNDLLKAKPEPKPPAKPAKPANPTINYKKVEKISMDTSQLGDMQKTGDFDFVLPDSRPDIPVEDIRLQRFTFTEFHGWRLGGIWTAPHLAWANLKKPETFMTPQPVRSHEYGYIIKKDQYITEITGLWLRSRIFTRNSYITSFGTLNLITNDGASYGFPDDNDRETNTVYRHALSSECKVNTQFLSVFGGSTLDSIIEKVIPIKIKAPDGHEIISVYGTFTQPTGLNLSGPAWRITRQYIGTLGIYTRPAKT